MNIHDMIEPAAIAMWQEESFRCLGRARRIPWSEVSDYTHQVWRDLAKAAMRAAFLVDQTRIRHNKRGSTYDVLGDATVQVSVGDRVFGGHKLRVIADDMKLRVYQGADDGELWVRFPDEFEERFTTVERETNHG